MRKIKTILQRLLLKKPKPAKKKIPSVKGKVKIIRAADSAADPQINGFDPIDEAFFAGPKP